MRIPLRGLTTAHRPRRVLVGPVAALVTLAALSGALPAAAAPTATPAATATPLVTPGVVDPALAEQLATDELTEAEVQAQKEEAARLTEDVAGKRTAVDIARTQVTILAEQAGTALQQQQTALRAQAAAESELALQEARLAAARVELGKSQKLLGRWAAEAYRTGGALADYEALITVLESDNSAEVGNKLLTLERLGRGRGEVVEEMTSAEEIERDATTKAAQARREAALSAAQAEAARERADSILAQQEEQTAVLERALGQTVSAAQQAGDKAALLEKAYAIAEQRRLAAETAAKAAAAAGRNAITGAVGDCKGAETSAFANGQIPSAALCPIWGASGHLLRADAAASFDVLSKAYAETFGTPMCVTDSYRSLASQIAVRAAKPTLAAVPGTSNHGWGVAVDLCDGVQNFGTAQHEWMRANAPLYGWFHPAWAQAGGSKPEAWHWEYGG